MIACLRLQWMLAPAVKRSAAVYRSRHGDVSGASGRPPRRLELQERLKCTTPPAKPSSVSGNARGTAGHVVKTAKVECFPWAGNIMQKGLRKASPGVKLVLSKKKQGYAVMQPRNQTKCYDRQKTPERGEYTRRAVDATGNRVVGCRRELSSRIHRLSAD